MAATTDRSLRSGPSPPSPLGRHQASPSHADAIGQCNTTKPVQQGTGSTEKGTTVSRTLHHPKPGTPRRPRRRYIPEGRHQSTLRRGMASADPTLDTAEPMATRRTR